MRVCADFHKLKADTVPMNYAMPHPQEALDKWASSIIFATLGILSGFHQISITERTNTRLLSGVQYIHNDAFEIKGCSGIFQKERHHAMGTLCGYGRCYVVYVNDTIIHYIPGGAQSAFGQSTSCPTQRLTTLALQRGVRVDVCPLSWDIFFPKTAYHPAQLNYNSTACPT